MKLFKIFYLVLTLLLSLSICNAQTKKNIPWEELPDITKIISGENDQVGVSFYSSDSILLGYVGNSHSFVKYDDISHHVINALIATEGLPVTKKRIVSVEKIANKRVAFSITGHLVKRLCPNKIRLAYKTMSARQYIQFIDNTARVIEKKLSAEQIMHCYLLTCDFGKGNIGIQNAAKGYFNKTASELNLEEAALLVGLIVAPIFNPVSHPHKAKKRRDVVLSLMKRDGTISEEEFSQIIYEKPIILNLWQPLPDLTLRLKEELNAIVLNNEDLLDTQNGNYIIQTTINSKMQEYAKKTLTSHLNRFKGSNGACFISSDSNRTVGYDDTDTYIMTYLKQTIAYQNLKKKGMNHTSILNQLNLPTNRLINTLHGQVDTLLNEEDFLRYELLSLNGSFVSMNPQSGGIRVWIGNGYSNSLNNLVDNKTIDPGSAFTPIYCATWFQETEDENPCSKMIDDPIKIMINGESSVPFNFNRQWSGKELTYRQALARGNNSFYSLLINKLGNNVTSKINSMSNLLGVKNKIESPLNIQVTPLELCNSYATIYNNGMRNTSYMIEKIIDKQGNVVWEHKVDTTRAISKKVADKMRYMFAGPSNEKEGTALALYKYRGVFRRNNLLTVNGSNEGRNSNCFVGMVPQLVTTVWIGPSNSECQFCNSNDAWSSNTSLTIWGDFMEELYKDSSLGMKKTLESFNYTCE